MARAKQHSTQKTPIQAWETNTRVSAVNHERTRRRKAVSVVTSSFGGKLIPLKMEGLFREDNVMQTDLTLNVQMAETASMLLNPVRISAAAYVVPKLAHSRFKDMGQIDRSYNGQQEVDGQVIPWFNTAPGADNDIFKALGVHFVPGSNVNLDYIEAYNVLWNFIAANRSTSLQHRAETDTSLGPAFWANTQMRHVVPTFDEAMNEGRVPLNLVGGTLAPVRGLGVLDGSVAPSLQNYRDTEGDKQGQVWMGNPQTPIWAMETKGFGSGEYAPNIYAELKEVMAGSISLADIDLARETAAWARQRTQYQGKSEEWMMDQLLAGMTIADEGLRNPILMDTSETVVGMSQRYATDSGNLQKSVTDGRTSLQLRLRSPMIPCGGTVVVVAQALPEQIYERQVDYYMQANTVADLPNRISDELDPQPVAMVANKEVDSKHTTPDGLFGYAPLNHQWTGGGPNVGGRYFRPDPNAAWTEDRNRIWDTGVIDPALGPDFYVASTLQHKVFQAETEEPFEWWLGGSLSMGGLTYFGPSLRESKDDYEKVLSKVSQERLIGDGTDTPITPAAQEDVIE